MYRVIFCVSPHRYNLNPETIKVAEATKRTAKVFMLLHGASASPSYFLPLASKLQESGIGNVFTASYNPSANDPVPIIDLSNRIKEITERYLKNGYENVEYTLVGHSLGAIIATKYIWRGKEIENTCVSKMISIAGRLKYITNKFAWFCKDIKDEIEMTFKAIVEDPNKVSLYTIWGAEDKIVPQESAHFQNLQDREYTVNGTGHLGVVLSLETHNQIAAWLQM
ncbi:MAG TPA: hypothetical protein VIH61_04245 [Waddliaceae bacterium]